MALIGLFWLGWPVVLLSTFMISHFDLFGLRQVVLNLQGRAYSHPAFTTRGFCRIVRHPIMLGHVVFAFATTAYVLIALQFEEHDLVQALGKTYRNYRKKVPMLIPWLTGKGDD